MDKLKMHSPDMSQNNLSKIQALFPNCITEAQDDNGKPKLAIDFDQLKQELSDSIVEGPQERYQLNWPGKRKALLTANAPIAKTLRPYSKESVNFDTTENLFIEGDNLDALKLLQETYLGKVKMIYIDPPYNTGSDLIYEDCFASDLDTYFSDSNQKDKEGNRLTTNSESNGRFHSDWLNMIYSRLKLARNILHDSGVIFISIGNDEVTNLKKVCDEIFGENNFVESITWNKRIPKNDKGVGNIHENILLYVKDSQLKHDFTMRKDGLDDIYNLLSKLKKRNTSIQDSEKEMKKLYKKNGYDRGITLYNSLDSDYKLWGKINMSWPNANTFGPDYEVLHPLTEKRVKMPDRGWRWKKETFEEAANISDGKYQKIELLHDGSVLCNKIWFAKDENTQPSSVTFLDDVNTFLLRSIISTKSDGGIEVEKLFEGKSYFSYPKPTSLIKTFISSIKCKNDDIILDFFAGSGTTADAVMQVNAEDGINRKYIAIQLDEQIDTKDIAHKAGYKYISELTKERLLRAGDKVLNQPFHSNWNKDVGFRTLKVDSSNMTDVYYNPDQISQADMFSQVENIKNDRSDEDLLFQVLLDWGVGLTLPISKKQLSKKDVFFVNADEDGDGADLVACFAQNINDDLIKHLAELHPLRVVFRDDGFASDAVKINAEQIFKQVSPGTDVKSI